jgi:hypothetical protein
MSRNGTGTYNLPAGNPVVTGTVITSTWANNTLTDIASALTGSVAADGQTPMSGDLDMNTNKIVNLEPGTVAGNAVEYTQATSAVAITGGAIDGTPIGNTTRSSGKFTTLAANAATTLTSTLDVTGVATFAANSQFNGTGALKLPVGTTAQQPTPATGMIRYNSTLNNFEGYYAASWVPIGGVAGGSNTQVQYNNAGALAGSSSFTFNGTTLATPTLALSNSTGITFSDASTQSSSVSVIGIGGSAQTWQDVTSSRSINTNYTNTTGRPIMVAINFNTGTSGIILVDGVFAGIGATTVGQATGGLNTIVPNGSVYRYNGLAAVLQWSELR